MIAGREGRRGGFYVLDPSHDSREGLERAQPPRSTAKPNGDDDSSQDRSLAVSHAALPVIVTPYVRNDPAPTHKAPREPQVQLLGAPIDCSSIDMRPTHSGRPGHSDPTAQEQRRVRPRFRPGLVEGIYHPKSVAHDTGRKGGLKCDSIPSSTSTTLPWNPLVRAHDVPVCHGHGAARAAVAQH